MKFLPLGIIALCIPAVLHADSVWPKECQPTTVNSEGILLSVMDCRPKGVPAQTWVLLHGLGSAKQEWLPLVSPILAAGEGVVVFDARGHGDSTRRADGSEIHYQEFRSREEWAGVVQDFGSVVAWLRKRKDSGKIAAGGASLGANAALLYAASDPRISRVLALSPGWDYAGLMPDPVLARLKGRPVLLVAAQKDEYAYKSVHVFRQAHPELGMLEAPADAGHGVNMLKVPLLTRILRWMKG